MNWLIFKHYFSNDFEESISSGRVDTVLGVFLSTLWNYLETEEIKFVLKKLLNTLLASFSETSSSLAYDRQRRVLIVLTCICNHPVTRKFYLENKFFKKHWWAVFSVETYIICLFFQLAAVYVYETTWIDLYERAFTWWTSMDGR